MEDLLRKLVLLAKTTDTDYEGPLERVHPNAADIAYLLNVANHFFPQAKLSERDVLTSWAGLRPLIADSRGRPSDISRSHEIHNPEPGWWDVAGGKLTTYRLMAEQVLDKIVAWLKSGGLAMEARPCRTANEPLLAASEVDGVSGILPPALGAGAVQNACVREWAVHLEDVMLRRTNWHYYHADAPAMANKAAQWMAE